MNPHHNSVLAQNGESLLHLVYLLLVGQRCRLHRGNGLHDQLEVLQLACGLVKIQAQGLPQICTD